MLQEILRDSLRVRVRQIDLVDRHDERHARIPRVRDRLDRLRHDGVVRGHDEYNDVGNLRTTSTHGRECFVAWRIEERDQLPSRQRDVVGTDVLRDAASLASHDVRLSDVVEERRLPVVDVTHDRDDRRSRDEILDFVDLRDLTGVRGVLLLTNGLEAELASDQLDLIEVESLVDRDHEAEALEREADDLRRRNLEDVGQLADGDEFVDVNGLPLALTIRLALSLHLLARRCIVRAPWAAAALSRTAE